MSYFTPQMSPAKPSCAIDMVHVLQSCKLIEGFLPL